MLKQDLARVSHYIKGSRLQKTIGCYRTPGAHAVIIFRFGQWLRKRNILIRCLFEPFYLFLNYRIKTNWGINLPRSTAIDEGLYIGHFGGITISGKAKIGKNVNISHQITIGVSGSGENRGVPVIGDHVYIGPGAKIFGKIKIGNNVKIGANAVVYKDIPDNAVVVSDPGFKIISYKGNRKK